MTPHRLVLPAVLLALAGPALAADLPQVKVELQPLAAQARRVADALELLGAPLSADERKALADAKDVDAVQAVLDKHCPLRRPRPAPGGRAVSRDRRRGGRPRQAGSWPNRAGASSSSRSTTRRGWTSSSCGPPAPTPPRSPSAPPASPTRRFAPVGGPRKRFLDLAMFNGQPLVRDLSGLEVEYRIFQIYCRDAGRKEAQLSFGLWREGDKDKPTAASGPVDYVFDSAPGRAGEAARPRRRRQIRARRPADHGRVHHHRLGRPRLSGDDAPPGARLQLPSADLPRRRRNRRAPARHLHRHLDARPRVPGPAAHRHGRRRSPEKGAMQDGDVRPQALGPPGRARLVLRRPPHPRRRLRPLRKPHRRRHARGHDAPRPRRGPRRRLLPQLGAVLVSPEALLRGQGQRPVHAGPSAPLRRGSVRLPVEPLRPHLPAAAAASRTTPARS